MTAEIKISQKANDAISKTMREGASLIDNRYVLIELVKSYLNSIIEDGWISVEDRLPENGQLVAMYNYDKAYYPDICYWDSSWDEDYKFGRNDKEVWFPLPAPPKEK